MSLVDTLTICRRVDWRRLLLDLRKKGMTTDQIMAALSIPKSTLLGYMNLDAEPRHCDGVRLVALWRSVMCPPLPTQDLKPRVRRAEK